MSGCIFCKIANKEKEAEIIYETENVLSFLDINPRAPGHSLVIPKKHARKLIDLEDELIADLFVATKEVMNILQGALNPDAFNVGINDGEAAGQEIPHLHVNLFPRFRGDHGKPVHAIVNNPPPAKISEMAERIRRQAREL